MYVFKFSVWWHRMQRKWRLKEFSTYSRNKETRNAFLYFEITLILSSISCHICSQFERDMSSNTSSMKQARTQDLFSRWGGKPWVRGWHEASSTSFAYQRHNACNSKIKIKCDSSLSWTGLFLKKIKARIYSVSVTLFHFKVTAWKWVVIT